MRHAGKGISVVLVLLVALAIVAGCATQAAPAPEGIVRPTASLALSSVETAAKHPSAGVAPQADKVSTATTKSPATSSTLPKSVVVAASPLPKAPLNNAALGEVRLMAVGDVSLGWEAGRRIVRRGPHAPWTRVVDFFKQADLVVANLECTISERGTRWPKSITIRAPLAAADSLVAGGIDVVSLANNHALDFGAEGFQDTVALLDERGIGHAGGGNDSTAAHAPLIVEMNGLRVAFLGYVLPFSGRPSFNTREWAAGPNRPGLAIGTPDVVGRGVALARAQADLVVVMMHGGTEYSHRPTKRQRAVAQAALDAGASLVLGHHPHVLQGYRSGAGRFVAYSLGNFVFDRFEGDANDSAILDVTLTAEGVSSFRWIPIVIDRGFPRPAVGSEIRRVLSRLPEL